MLDSRCLEPANVYIRSVSVVETSGTEFWYSGRCVNRSGMLRVGKDIPDRCRIPNIISVMNNTSATRHIRTQHCPVSHLPALLSCTWSSSLFTKQHSPKVQIPLSIKSKYSLQFWQQRAVCPYFTWQWPILSPYTSLLLVSKIFFISQNVATFPKTFNNSIERQC